MLADPAVNAETELQATVTEANIALFVERFYGSVQQHPTLGPVFNERLEGRWDTHLAQMKDFWSSVLLRSGRYQGYPLRAHFGVPGIEKRHFGDWLALFDETLKAVYQPEVAEAIHGVSRQIAKRFSYALFDRE